MLKIKFLNSFKKDYKRIVKRGYDIALLEVEEAKVIKDVARYAIFTSPSFHSTSNPRASQRARTGA